MKKSRMSLGKTKGLFGVMRQAEQLQALYVGHQIDGQGSLVEFWTVPTIPGKYHPRLRTITTPSTTHATISGFMQAGFLEDMFVFEDETREEYMCSRDKAIAKLVCGDWVYLGRVVSGILP